MLKATLENQFVWAYFAIGIAILIYVGFKAFAEYQSKSDFAKSLSETLGVKRTFKDQFESLLVYFISVIVVLLCWPVFIAWACFQWFKDKQELLERSKPRFFCKNEFLVKKVSALEAEKNSLVFDPLSMTPAIPFGHLNGAWCDFLSLLEEDDSVWYFEIPQGRETGKEFHCAKGLMKGYAQVRKQKIIAEFVTQSS